MTVQIELPPKLIPAFIEPARYRGSYGGRGSGKTRSFAKMAAVWGYKLSCAGKSGIILCAREFMNSLDDSSMAEVKAAIASEPLLREFYDVGEKYIRTKDRRISFKFSGLRHNIDSIKSKARIHLLWVDEAESVSEVAWEKATKSVRETDSEIWVTWNPEREDSPTHKRFRLAPPDGAQIVELNWRDNPWFPDVLEKERLYDLKRDPDKYNWVWEGGFLTHSNARVFHNWKVEEFSTPPDARFYFGADWGYANDPTVLVRSFIQERKLFIDQEAFEIGCEIDQTPKLFDQINSSRQWPITADSARPETISYMQRHGYPRIKSALKGASSVEDGIEFLKSYDIVVHPRCRHTIEELTHYRWKTDPLTEEVLPILEDKNNHVIDALRYALEGTRKSTYTLENL